MSEIDKFKKSGVISLHVHIAGENTLDKLTAYFARSTTNNLNSSNIRIQNRHLQNTYIILNIHLALWNVSWILHVSSRN